MNIKFELWVIKGKKRRVIVKRDEKNKFKSWRYQKGSGIKTLKQAKSIYTKTQNLYKDRVRIKSKDAKSVTIKKVKDFKRFRQIGKNTGIIISKTPIKEKDTYQIVAELKFAKKTKTYKGFSQIAKDITKETKQAEALKNAMGQARLDNIIPYPYQINLINREEGWVFSPSGHIRVHFTVKYYVQTYIKTIEK